MVLRDETDGAASLGVIGSVDLLCVWKKPLSDCCPLLPLVDTARAPGLPRLIGFPGDAEADARRFSADLRGLCENVVLFSVSASISALEASIAKARSLSICSSAVLAVLATSAFVVTSS